MRRLTPLLLAALVVALPALAQEPPKESPKDAPEAPAGSWKFFLPLADRDADTPLWLLKLEQADGKWTGKVAATAPRWPEMKLTDLTVKDGVAKFQLRSDDLTLPVEVKVVKGAEVLRGTTTFGGDVTAVELHTTALASLDGLELARESLTKKPLGAEAAQLALGLLSQAEKNKAKPAEVRAWADKASRSAELYGPAWHREVLLLVARMLTRQEGYEPVALQYAQRAERMLGEKETPAAQKKVLDVLAAALEKGGKKEDAALVQARLKKLDFRIKTTPYAGRKGKSERVVLVEAFTGSECKPCVAADLALEALAKSFAPGELVVLRYHLHLPEPDPLAGEDGAQRAEFYQEQLKGLPTVLVNGQPVSPGGGPVSEAQRKYDDYRAAVVAALEAPAGATLELNASRKGAKVTLKATAGAVKEPEDVRLRVALLEDAVAYKGGNGQVLHQAVVRTLPGGDAGKPLTAKGAEAAVTVDLEELAKKHKAYLDKYGEKRPFPNKERPLELKKLRAVAWVQNDKTGEVLQARAVEVTGE